jgi:hypothetical protein
MKSIRIAFALLVVTGFVAMIMPTNVWAQDKSAQTTAPEQNSPPSLAKILNVKDKMVKTMMLTAQQKEMLNTIFTTHGTAISSSMGVMTQGFSEELTARINQDYAEELGKITTLPEDKREAANAALMQKAVPVVFDKVAPKTKKDAVAGLRQSFTMMFTQIDNNITKAQKPQLLKIKKQFFLDFDKELPKFMDGAFDEMKKEMLNSAKAGETGKGEN